MSKLVWVSKQPQHSQESFSFLTYKCPGLAEAHFGLGWRAAHSVLGEQDQALV